MPNTVLITGTSSGYGKAMAELFLERGWNVLATMRRPDPALFAASSDRLTVLPLEEIARTLNSQGKNKGLWFDVEMVKHCGQEYRVSARVQKIIDDATGQVRFMKTPCIMLETVDSTGEGLHFNPQHDPIFWRESWLRRTESPS